MNYAEYHPDWKDIIRPQILKRDNYKCRHCGVRHKAKVYRMSNNQYHECDEFEYQWAKANNKKPFQLFLNVCHVDHDKNNNDQSNLISLCPRCHGKFDKQNKKFRKLIYQAKVQPNSTLHITRTKYAISEVLDINITEIQAETIYNLITKTK
jgi:hypothetical protein